MLINMDNSYVETQHKFSRKCTPFFFFSSFSHVLTLLGIIPSNFTKSHSQIPYSLESLVWVNLFLWSIILAEDGDALGNNLSMRKLKGFFNIYKI